MPYRGFPTDLERVAIYLRKSREDQEAEERARREGRTDIDTLTRHRNRLLEVSRTNRFNIVAIYEEVVSGESIDARPEVLRLLDEVEAGSYDAVLCIDIDRLGRGDMADQGIIQRVFRDAETLIITEDRVYDLQDDNDEEQVEFKAFFARRELKRITKRMQSGRRDSVSEGNYIGTYEPFGYMRDRNRGLFLLPSERAPIVKMMFEWCAYEDLGGRIIADRLNEMQIPSPVNDWNIRHGREVNPSKIWTPESVNYILHNEVYIGRLQWAKTRTVKRKVENGRYRKVKNREQPRDTWMDVEGRHEPIIDKALFDAVQQKMSGRASLRGPRSVRNPLRGIVTCKVCGKPMQLRPYAKQGPHLMCPTKGCSRSTRFEYVETMFLSLLRDTYEEYRVKYGELERRMTHKKNQPRANVPDEVLKQIEKEIATIRQQRDNIHTLLERGVYDTDTFLERNKVLVESLSRLEAQRDTIVDAMKRQESDDRAQRNVVPLIRHVLDVYTRTEDPKEKNHLLRQVVDKAIYYKAGDWRGDHFELELYPRLP